MREFESRFRKLWGAGAIVTTVGPLPLWLTTGLVPPWPRAAGVIASVFSAIGVACVYGSLRSWKPRSRGWLLPTIGAVFLLLGVAGGLFYVQQNARYVVEVEQPVVGSDSRQLSFVIGDELLAGQDAAQPAGVLLADNAYDPFAVWTRASVVRARVRVALSFFITFLLMSTGMAVLALHSDGLANYSANR